MLFRHDGVAKRKSVDEQKELKHFLRQNSHTGCMYISRYNHELYNILWDDEDCGGHSFFHNDIPVEKIREKIARARDYLNIPIFFHNENMSMYINDDYMLRPISSRQADRATATISLIMDENYGVALHEFADCVSDYGRGTTETQPKAISLNEHALYSCIIACFAKKLEISDVNISTETDGNQSRKYDNFIEAFLSKIMDEKS